MFAPSTRPASLHPRSRLDRAILASLIAMAGFNLFVLAQQAQPSATLAVARAQTVQTA